MSDSPGSQPFVGSPDHQSALFAHLLMQQTNMAMMLLGKIPHPETGKTDADIDSARIFIDMIEMLEAKTKGNLTHDESRLLKQTLMSLRMSFVEAVEAQSAQPKPAPAPAAPQAEPAPQTGSAPKTPSTSEEDEHRKKFSKKY